MKDYLPQKPRHQWSDDERRMHGFIPKVIAILAGLVLLGGLAVYVLLRFLC